jgi:hypothetical protein
MPPAPLGVVGLVGFPWGTAALAGRSSPWRLPAVGNPAHCTRNTLPCVVNECEWLLFLLFITLGLMD